jgi:NADPH-dependent 2,4-dienoyl-CoA reductase/sulfur reductase-like enzyme
VGASFIGLEVAAALRARNIEVHVVAPEEVPLERVMGKEIGERIKRLHESHGVIFHLKDGINPDGSLRSGTKVEHDLLVLGMGVRPSVELAEKAGLTVDRGIVVSEYLETSAPGVYAAGDVARYPDPWTGKMLRIEHFVVAERMGQIAARSVLGKKTKVDLVPFFWSNHYDVSIRYVGHAETFTTEVSGDLEQNDATVAMREEGKIRAVAAIGRDRVALECAAA